LHFFDNDSRGGIVPRPPHRPGCPIGGGRVGKAAGSEKEPATGGTGGIGKRGLVEEEDIKGGDVKRVECTSTVDGEGE